MAGPKASLNVQGDLEVVNLLRELPLKVERKGVRAAVTAMTTPIARAAKAKAPRVYTGLLKKAIGKKTKAGRSKGSAVGLVGARRSVEGAYKGKRWVPANYIHLVELGTKPHGIPTKDGGTVQHPGSPAKPFLEPAYEEQKSAAERAGAEKLKQVVEAEAKKLGKL